MSGSFIPPPPLPPLHRIRKSAQRQWPHLVVLSGVLVALGVVATHHFRRGTFLIGLCLLLHAGLRGFLPDRRAGWLAVRSRTFDVAVSVAFGIALVLLTVYVPAPASG